MKKSRTDIDSIESRIKALYIIVICQSLAIISLAMPSLREVLCKLLTRIIGLEWLQSQSSSYSISFHSPACALEDFHGCALTSPLDSSLRSPASFCRNSACTSHPCLVYATCLQTLRCSPRWSMVEGGTSSQHHQAGCQPASSRAAHVTCRPW